MKIIITHPDFGDPGGVAKYYSKLKDKFGVPIQHYIIGKRPDEKGYYLKIYRLINDYIGFLKNMKDDQCELIHVNPSLDFKSFLRDGIFLLLARILRKKTVVFFRGWSKAFESKLERRGIWVLKFLYGNSNAFIVLASEFKRKLEAWGFKRPIYLEVTVADDAVLNGFNIHQALSERLKSQKWRVLFISRIYKAKGIYETINAISMLYAKYPAIELIVAGEGDELENVKSFVRDLSLKNVAFTGYIKGEEKKRILRSANILCFPSYTEGLPNTIIEAMAFGLPVVTSPVGGIADFFKNEKHGFATTSKDPKIIADFIERLYKDRQLYIKISLYNYKYAQSNFMASKAALRLEKIYKSVLMKP